ncbi:MAG: phosphatase PAP2 family protein [Pseudomonadota bacterium]
MTAQGQQAGWPRRHAALIGGCLAAVTAGFALDPVLRVHGEALHTAYQGLPEGLRWLLHHLHWSFYLAYAAVAARALARRDRQGLQVVAAYVLAQMLVALVLVRALKIAVGRPRPLADDGMFRPLALDSAHNSFPSGHAADAAVGFGVAVRAGAAFAWRGLALVGMLLVMFLRVIELKHHPSDVVCGALMGSLGSWWLAEWWLRRRGGHG